MAAVADIVNDLIARYNNLISSFSVADMGSQVKRALVERAIEKKARAVASQGGGSGGGGVGSGITQAEVKTAIETATSIDALESGLQGIDTKIGNIAGFVDGLEGFTGGIDGTLSTISGKIPSLGQASVIASLPVALPASQIAEISGGGSVAEIAAYPTQNKVAVTDAGVMAIAANTNRLHAIVKNRSQTQTIEITLGTPALNFGTSLELLPGEAYEITGSNLWKGAVCARTATGITAELSILEGV